MTRGRELVRAWVFAFSGRGAASEEDTSSRGVEEAERRYTSISRQDTPHFTASGVPNIFNHPLEPPSSHSCPRRLSPHKSTVRKLHSATDRTSTSATGGVCNTRRTKYVASGNNRERSRSKGRERTKAGDKLTPLHGGARGAYDSRKGRQAATIRALGSGQSRRGHECEEGGSRGWLKMFGTPGEAVKLRCIFGFLALGRWHWLVAGG